MRLLDILNERNVINAKDNWKRTPSVAFFIQQCLERTDNALVKKWINNNLWKYMINEFPAAQIHNFTGEQPQWIADKLANGETPEIFVVPIGDAVANEITPAIDYLNNLEADELRGAFHESVPELIRRAKNWHLDLATGARSKDVAVPDDPNGKQEFLNVGQYTWYRLLSGQALDFEGEHMGHCVGGDSYEMRMKEGRIEIYSLRSKNGKPHVTVEVTVNSKEKEIYQIQGTANSVPKPKYHSAIKAFVNECGAKLPRRLQRMIGNYEKKFYDKNKYGNTETKYEYGTLEDLGTKVWSKDDVDVFIVNHEYREGFEHQHENQKAKVVDHVFRYGNAVVGTISQSGKFSSIEKNDFHFTDRKTERFALDYMSDKGMTFSMFGQRAARIDNWLAEDFGVYYLECYENHLPRNLIGKFARSEDFDPESGGWKRKIRFVDLDTINNIKFDFKLLVNARGKNPMAIAEQKNCSLTIMEPVFRKNGLDFHGKRSIIGSLYEHGFFQENTTRSFHDGTRMVEQEVNIFMETIWEG